MPCILCLNAAVIFAEAPPDWFTPLQDAVYADTHDADSIASLGNKIEETAKRELSEPELSNMLSLCEFFIGKAYQNEQNAKQALTHFQLGLDYAGVFIKTNPTSNGYRMMAENISQICTMKSAAWVIANGLKVEQYAKKGLAYNSRNAACSYLIAARWVYAPAPFNNIKKGINEMKTILSGSYDIQKDDYFNIYYAIAYAYNRTNQTDEVMPWLEKALAIYPTNKDALNLKQGKARIIDTIDSYAAETE